MSDLSNSKGARRTGAGAHRSKKAPAATNLPETSKQASAASARRRRPKMTIEQCALVCDRMAEGQSLRSICLASDMPPRPTFMRFVAKNALAAEMYGRAIEARADVHFEEIIAIADDPTLKTTDQIRRAKLRIEARQWTVQRMNPQKYSERLRLHHGGDQDAPPMKTEIGLTPPNGTTVETFAALAKKLASEV